MKPNSDGHVQRAKWLSRKASDAAKVLDGEVIPREQHRATLEWMAEYLTRGAEQFREQILDVTEPDPAVVSEVIHVRRHDFIETLVRSIPVPDDEHSAETN